MVVLSEQPYSSALIPLAQYAGPLYFNIGQTAMEEVKLTVLVTPWKPYYYLRTLNSKQHLVRMYEGVNHAHRPGLQPADLPCISDKAF